jgi:hypothetical protein
MCRRRGKPLPYRHKQNQTIFSGQSPKKKQKRDYCLTKQNKFAKTAHVPKKREAAPLQAPTVSNSLSLGKAPRKDKGETTV